MKFLAYLVFANWGKGYRWRLYKKPQVTIISDGIYKTKGTAKRACKRWAKKYLKAEWDWEK